MAVPGAQEGLDLESQIYELFIRFKNASKATAEVEYSK